ncbi:hypothetical protein KKG71_01260, partial [Patescibacteria group bacterium]|nr:hypothetical protein [Patescibacteria group bacterium]
ALIGLLAHLTYFASTILVTEIDAQLYHLPIVINWIQNLSTHIPFNSAFAGPIGYYPANQELYFSWNILPFRSDILINLSNIPIYLLFIILISKIGDILNQDSTKKTIFLILFIASPIVLRQAASVPQGDVFLAFFILSSIYYLLKLSKNSNFKKNSFLLACTIGIGLGIKYTSLIFFLPIMIGFLLISIKKYQQLKIPTTLLNLLIITIGGYFYIRNYIYTQNPFFPGELSILSQTLFKGYKGYTEKILQDSIWHNLTHNYSPALIKELAQNHLNSIGYTIIFVIIGFFSPIGCAIKSLYKKKYSKSLLQISIFLSLCLWLIFYLKAPWTIHATNIRYGISLYMACLGLFTLFCIPKKWKTAMFLITLLLTLLTYLKIPDSISSIWGLNSFLYNQYPLHTTIFTVILLSIFGCTYGLIKKKKHIFIPLLPALIISSALFLQSSNMIRNENGFNQLFKEAYYSPNKMSHTVEMFKWVQANIPKNANISYANFIFPYYLYGGDYARNVSYTNVNNCPDCLYHDFIDSDESILVAKSYDDWLNNLKADQIDYFVLGFLSEDMSNSLPKFYYEWTENNPKTFKEIYRSENGRIFEISYE